MLGGTPEEGLTVDGAPGVELQREGTRKAAVMLIRDPKRPDEQGPPCAFPRMQGVTTEHVEGTDFYLVRGVPVAIVDEEILGEKISAVQSKLPYSMKASRGPTDNGAMKTKDFLENDVRMHDAWLRLCLLGKLEKPIRPIHISFCTDRNSAVDRELLGTFVYDETRRRHRIQLERAEAYSHLTLEVNPDDIHNPAMPLFMVITKQHLLHELGHVASTANLPLDEVISEAAAEMLLALAWDPADSQEWDEEPNGIGPHRVLFGDSNCGYNLNTDVLPMTGHLRNYHRSIGLLGARALWHALGESKENLRKMLEISGPHTLDKESVAIPTMLDWLHKMDQAIPGFRERLFAKRILQTIPPGARTIWFQNKLGWGELQSFDIEANPDYGYCKQQLPSNIDHDQLNILRLNGGFDLEPTKRYSDLPLRVRCMHGEKVLFERTTTEKGRAHIIPSNLLIFLREADVDCTAMAGKPLRVLVESPEKQGEWRDIGKDFIIKNDHVQKFTAVLATLEKLK